MRLPLAMLLACLPADAAEYLALVDFQLMASSGAPWRPDGKLKRP